ncbi:PHP domain-containing protein [Candidatus Caldatribacterium saccharofermentans]|uniref:Phosphatase n=1 Tax=Candidatus Caldatribacterium saccharofermentans TaxID=1454753 RepID=A0A7V4TFK2_9BACT
MEIIADLHVHTIASGHGYSTILENVQVAKRKGLLALGIADHTPSMPGGPSPLYFEARGHFPREVLGVRLYFGAEVDILDEEGHLDLPERILRRLDFVIVSLHPQVFQGGSREVNTRALLRALEHPLVDIVAHPGNPRYPLDYAEVVGRAVRLGKVIEINNSSFSVSRRGSEENCRLIAQEVKSRGGWVMVSSDAHFCEEVGEFGEALRLLEDVGFPRERIVNASLKNLEDFFERVAQRRRNP